MSTTEPSERDPADIDERFLTYRRTGDRSVRNALVADHLSLAEACARRFVNRGEPLDDLEQVAMVGLVKAVDRFDPRQGVPFAGFAVPTITGELRRHFRDATWALKVPRGAKDLHVQIPPAAERLRVALGRPPTPAELAEELGVGLDHVIAALDAGSAYRTTSTDTTDGSIAASHATRRNESPAYVQPEDRLMLISLMETLPERERTIVGLRFFDDRSQAEIAEQMGMSQVHVSRLLRKALRQMSDAHQDADAS